MRPSTDRVSVIHHHLQRTQNIPSSELCLEAKVGAAKKHAGEIEPGGRIGDRVPSWGQYLVREKIFLLLIHELIRDFRDRPAEVGRSYVHVDCHK